MVTPDSQNLGAISPVSAKSGEEEEFEETTQNQNGEDESSDIEDIMRDSLGLETELLADDVNSLYEEMKKSALTNSDDFDLVSHSSSRKSDMKTLTIEENENDTLAITLTTTTKRILSPGHHSSLRLSNSNSPVSHDKTKHIPAESEQWSNISYLERKNRDLERQVETYHHKASAMRKRIKMAEESLENETELVRQLTEQMDVSDREREAAFAIAERERAAHQDTTRQVEDLKAKLEESHKRCDTLQSKLTEKNEHESK
jgi:hypothetical protein